jgi:4'-phosphopantetheinyl transferase
MLHMAARVAIGSRLAVYPTLVAIDHEPNGRPIADGVALSMSHSGALGAVAITRPDVRVGVDVEVVRPRRYPDRIARRVFTTGERAWWTALDDDARVLALLRRWTEVEALVKADGTGLARGLRRVIPRPAGWSCEPIDCGPGFVGTVAAEAGSIEVRVRRLRAERASG